MQLKRHPADRSEVSFDRHVGLGEDTDIDAAFDELIQDVHARIVQVHTVGEHLQWDHEAELKIAADPKGSPRVQPGGIVALVLLIDELTFGEQPTGAAVDQECARRHDEFAIRECG
jgi:hypothetical protein